MIILWEKSGEKNKVLTGTDFNESEKVKRQ